MELLVGVPDAGLRQVLREQARTVMDVILIAPPAIDVDALERLEIRLVAVDEQDRIVLEPSLPAFFDDLAGLEIERQAETQGAFGSGS